MNNKECVICLGSESTTRLFNIQGAENEDGQNYEYLIGIKLKCPTFMCQRCSIDLGLTVYLKKKALQSFKIKFPSNNVPIVKNNPTMTSTAMCSNMSRTEKIMSSAGIISSTVVNPPMDLSTIDDLFKNKPNISLIKAKVRIEEKSESKYNTRINKRRQTICVNDLLDLQKKMESQDKKKLSIPSSFKKTVEKTNVKEERNLRKRKNVEVVDKNKKYQKVEDEKNSKGRNPPENETRRRLRSSDPEYQYWIKTKAEGYYTTSFKSIDDANAYIENLPSDASYGPLSVI